MNKKVLSLFSVAVVLLLSGAFVIIWLSPTGAAETTAQALFQRNCSACHGVEGRGEGPAAFLLNPKPRNFRAGKFRLVTSKNLQPTRDDILNTISNGMPGTGMPAWSQLAENERVLLADYVVKLNHDGYVERAVQSGEGQREAEEYAREMSTPDHPIPIPPEPPITPAGLEQGRKFYVENCSKCHGENGEGRRDPTWRTSEGHPTWSRNLKEGVFKGGRDGKSLFLRFHTGLPGTPMPSLDVPGETVWRIVQYVQSLSDPAAQEQATVRPIEIVTRRVSRLPVGPADQLWDAAPQTRVALMPLWWVKGYIPEVKVKAVHDGQRIALMVEWADGSKDEEGVRPQSFPDGAAIQLAAADNPPLFAMGAVGELVNIWHWKALWDLDRVELHDVAEAYPNLVDDRYFGGGKGWNSGPLEDPTFIPARELGNPVSRVRKSSVEEANAAGFGTYTAQAPQEQNVDGASTWKNGVWRVVFVRDLHSAKGADLEFRRGEKVSVAFAVWNGGVAERNGQKTVSIWNTLTLE